ncbi:ABC transporter ATP-binding protein [Haliangium sp.]|uniref:ABC transporter ATP-binding protein n=1 Tax=Haliangium sp. TaxID=2663208 RepID=UPI003D0997DD
MIQLVDVHKGFDGVPLLSGLALEIPAGQALGVIGPAASGKSVLLKLLCGLVPADRGTITVAGCEVSAADEDQLADLRRRVGMQFQQSALFDFLSVYDNVAFPLQRRPELDPDEVDRLVRERLRQVGLAGSEDKLPAQLSGGMRKRVGLARATVGRPELTLYDEPTAGLDPVTTSKIYDLMRAEKDATGGTVVVVSSDVDALLGFADQIAMLLNGRIHHCGPADAIRDADDPAVRQFVRGELEGPLP